ncbi:hypothetical protein F2Q68_00024922 [Brassica cretica]|uniref:Ubiquitin-like protease family profile domain-containing protein n=1 Tax=Brassica cretica TaxID=69181 RepID=A0A3N6QMB9_BRACR|nr:hypothetical protein F2Q68_00024922 [Brassica cretica]
MRCRNWKGSAKVSYADIISLESNFGSNVRRSVYLHLFNYKFRCRLSAEFDRPSEMRDERVNLMIEMHRKKYDWSKHVWAYQETVQPFEYSSEKHGSAEEEAGEASPNEVEEEIESTPVSAAIKRKNKSEPSVFTTPVTSFWPEIFNRPSLNNIDDPEVRCKDSDYELVFVPEDKFSKLSEWILKPKVLQIGPSKFDAELASRIMGPNEWLKNYDMDAMMYLFREKTSLRRLKPNRVAFMNCMFSNQIITAYGKFDGNRRGYKVDNNLLEYGRGELPYHGSTGSVWSVDVDRLYIPIYNNIAVEAFAVLIPRIVKAVQSSDKKKDFNVKQYTVSYVPMRALNKSGNDCGAYFLKFIECHLLGLDFSLVNDKNIQEARHKIAFDLWEAANDEVLQYRMSTFKPPKRAPEKTVELFCVHDCCL